MLPSNAFSTVTVHGLLRKDGVLIPCTFERGLSRTGELCEFDWKDCTVCDGLPSRPPSNLPPPGNQNLSITLGTEVLGSGRIGTIHHATLLTDEHNTSLPPLVVKISRRERTEEIEKEAWFYEELEQIQGIAVPRCYGFFQTYAGVGTEVLAWRDKKSRKAEVKLENRPTLLSVLILERLGERIPMRKPESYYATIEPDVYEIFEDIATLGLQHLDVRWSNILSVSQYSDLTSTGPVCPNHGHAHQWRVIDFDMARKTNGTTEYVSKGHNSYLERVFDNVPYGCVVEPWE